MCWHFSFTWRCSSAGNAGDHLQMHLVEMDARLFGPHRPGCAPGLLITILGFLQYHQHQKMELFRMINEYQCTMTFWKDVSHDSDPLKNISQHCTIGKALL